MNSEYSLKVIVLGIMLSMTLWSDALAQKEQVIYHPYGQLERDYLRLLKTDGLISSFTSMSTLKKNALDLRERITIPVNLLPEEKKKMMPPELIAQRRESAPLICLYIPEEKLPEKVVTFASAIVLSEDGVCATNYHVLSGLIDHSIKLNTRDSLLFIAIGEKKLYSIISILSYDKAADIALFKVDTRGDKLKAIPIGHDLAEGEDVQALTHADGYPFFYSRGYVHRTVLNKGMGPSYNRMEMSADYAVGSSGGPIMDNLGNLVAMVSTTRSVYAVPNIQKDLQMVVKSTIPISSILRLTKTTK